jgi:hypothetical protein
MKYEFYGIEVSLEQLIFILPEKELNNKVMAVLRKDKINQNKIKSKCNKNKYRDFFEFSNNFKKYKNMRSLNFYKIIMSSYLDKIYEIFTNITEFHIYKLGYDIYLIGCFKFYEGFEINNTTHNINKKNLDNFINKYGDNYNIINDYMGKDIGRIIINYIQLNIKELECKNYTSEF